MKKLNSKTIILFITLVSLITLFVIADPDTGYLDPDGDGATLEWTSTGANHYTEIDECETTGRQPNVPTVADYITASGLTEKEDIVSMEDLASVDEVTAIEIWVYGRRTTTGSPIYIDISLDGGTSWEGEQSTATALSASWKSVTFNGSWDQAEINDLVVKFRAAIAFGSCTAYAMYAEITYTEVAADTCTYSAGDWNINCSDNCEITDAVDMGGNDVIISGTGTFILRNNITNYANRYILGTDTVNRCEIYCYEGCFR